MGAGKKTVGRQKGYGLLGGALLLAALCLWLAWGNRALTVQRYTIASPNLPPGFAGFRMAQVSDLHNARFGQGNGRLLSLLGQTGPDCILLTGDLIDSRRTDVETALDFVRQAAKIAPVYYVSGNHEARIPAAYEALKAGLKKAGATVLENQWAVLERKGDAITLLGLCDPSFGAALVGGDESAAAEAALAPLLQETEGYRVLLCHRPELFSLYAAAGVDVAFCGHAHGGQIRLPFIGGLYAPGQGLFPAYDGGLYAQGNTAMVVSRGLGNSIFPLRIHNRPEIILAELTN